MLPCELPVYETDPAIPVGGVGVAVGGAGVFVAVGVAGWQAAKRIKNAAISISFFIELSLDKALMPQSSGGQARVKCNMPPSLGYECPWVC